METDRPPVYLRIDDTEIETPDQLINFADNKIHNVETIFYAKFNEPNFCYKTHLYVGRIQFLQDLMIIDYADEKTCINVSTEKPVKTDYHLWYWMDTWRGDKTMQLISDENLEVKK